MFSLQWHRVNGAAGFKGNACYDFVISHRPNKAPDHELMLWLQWEGGQKPIGTGKPVVRIDNLYGQSWTLYEGINQDIGVNVKSLLPDRQYTNGFFQGDMKLWLNKLVEARKFPATAYISAANLGSVV